MGRMILNNALRSIVNAERRGKATVELQPISTVMSSFLKIMKHRGYIKDFEVFDPHRVGRITVQLQGRVNDCRALTYRQDVKAKDIEEYKFRTLPTRQMVSWIMKRLFDIMWVVKFLAIFINILWMRREKRFS